MTPTYSTGDWRIDGPADDRNPDANWRMLTANNPHASTQSRQWCPVRHEWRLRASEPCHRCPGPGEGTHCPEWKL